MVLTSCRVEMIQADSGGSEASSSTLCAHATQLALCVTGCRCKQHKEVWQDLYLQDQAIVVDASKRYPCIDPPQYSGAHEYAEGLRNGR